MGEIPRSIIISFEDGNDVMILYGCINCETVFGVCAELKEENPNCPVCTTPDGVYLMLEYT